MQPTELLKILSAAEKLKCNTRHCYTSSGRVESVAEHCWRLSLMVLLVEDEFPTADINKILKMCIIHDFGEAFTGDIPVFEKTARHEKTEESALSSWLDTLPSPVKEEWSALFAEMSELETQESKVYKALDALEAVVQHDESDISTWLPLEYELQFTHGKDKVEFSPYLKKLKTEIDRVTQEKIEGSKK